MPSINKTSISEKSTLLHRSRELRRSNTEAEKRIWYYLRAKRMLGLKFKRQVVLGKYIADFVCLEKKLIIEVDGGQHMEQQAYDVKRSLYLESLGYIVLRFWNSEVLEQTQSVLDKIYKVCGGT